MPILYVLFPSKGLYQTLSIQLLSDLDPFNLFVGFTVPMSAMQAELTDSYEMNPLPEKSVQLLKVRLGRFFPSPSSSLFALPFSNLECSLSTSIHATYRRLLHPTWTLSTSS